MTQGTPSKHFVFALVSSSSSSCDGRTKLFRIMFFTKDFHDCTSSVVVNFISRQFFGWYIIPLVLSKFLVALLFFLSLFFFYNFFAQWLGYNHLISCIKSDVKKLCFIISSYILNYLLFYITRSSQFPCNLNHVVDNLKFI